MSVQQYQNVSYGLTQPLNVEAALPIVSTRNPGVADKAQIGTIWINQLTNNAWILTSITNNQVNWELSGGGGVIGDFTSVDVNPGNLTIDAGDLSITEGNANIGGSLTVESDITMTAGSLSITEGDVTIEAGNLEVTEGNIAAVAGEVQVGTYISFLSPVGPTIRFGAGDPNGVVAATQGSLYLNTAGSTTSNRLWVNTTGVTAWAYVTTSV